MLKVSRLNFSWENALFHHTPFIENLSFSVKTGEILGIIGPNGAGKSTLLQLCAGILKPDSGVIMINNHSINNWHAKKRACHIAWVPPLTVPFFNFSVSDIITMGFFHSLGYAGSLNNTQKNKVKTILKELELDHLSDHLITKISSGEQQRTMLGRALIQEPDFLLLDEPFGYLDIKHQQRIASLLKNAVKEKQLGILLTTHDINWSAALSDHILVLKEGKMTAYGVSNEVLNATALQDSFKAEIQLIKKEPNGFFASWHNSSKIKQTY
ncbi:ABC transporter ATP-binding protein [Thermoproteota archaeon]